MLYSAVTNIQDVSKYIKNNVLCFLLQKEFIHTIPL